MRISCAVVGATGYVGTELVGLIAHHEHAELVSVHADSSAGKRWADLLPGRAPAFRGTIDAFDPPALEGLDVVFLALPHGGSARAARELRGRVGRVIDLSGDLRLPDAASYRKWYGLEHPAPELLGLAAYGLPELFGSDLPGADLIACAGCYATVSQIAAAPVVGRDGEGAGEVVVSAMSGTTGAGRKADVDLSFSEVTGNIRAYRVGGHPHAPEIANGLGRLTGREIRVTFVPHLAPIGRGIFASVVVSNAAGLGASDAVRLFQHAYEGRSFVRVVDPAVRLPQIKDVVGTNVCEVAPVVDEAAGTIVVLGVIDNLLKGAAGQAVQIMNVAFELPEGEGLLTWPAGEVCRA